MRGGKWERGFIFLYGRNKDREERRQESDRERRERRERINKQVFLVFKTAV